MELKVEGKGKELRFSGKKKKKTLACLACCCFLFHPLLLAFLFADSIGTQREAPLLKGTQKKSKETKKNSCSLLINMGVKNLWELLSPCGRRVNIETLEGKVLAIDVSLWLVQFLKAMRDEEGNMVKNAHLLGMIRRILRLMFHRIRPVFVFDGATPILKMNTIRARRSMREKQEVSKRTTAQRIFLSQLKQQEIKNRLKSAGVDTETTGQFASTFRPPPIDDNSGSSSSSSSSGKSNSASSSRKGHENTDEMGGRWPRGGSTVLVHLDENSDITGKVTTDGKLAESLRLVGHVGIITAEGESFEVPYPSDAVTLLDDDVAINNGSSSSSSSSSSSRGSASSHIATGISSSDLFPEYDGDARKGKAAAATAGNDGDDDDDDVMWVDGYENLRSKKADPEEEEDDDDQGSEGGGQWILPDDSSDIDVEVLASLPTELRKNMILAARRKERKRSQSTYLPVKTNPALYSQTQLANFLNSRYVSSDIPQ